MDPLTLATAFADVVSLLGQFLASRKERQQQTIDDYLEWLRRENHQQVVDLLTDNAGAAKAIGDLLNGQHDTVMAKLAALDATLSSVASRLPDFRVLAIAVHPDSAMSDQAASILQQMNAANATSFIELQTQGGTDYIFMEGGDGNLTISEDRFIDDDLETLCNLGLLRPDITSQGSRKYIITRLGAKVGAAIS